MSDRSGYRESFSDAQWRRDCLVDWMREKLEHQGLTVSEIVDVAGIYRRMYGGVDQCRRDLYALAAGGTVESSGRPARWRLR